MTEKRKKEIKNLETRLALEVYRSVTTILEEAEQAGVIAAPWQNLAEALAHRAADLFRGSTADDEPEKAKLLYNTDEEYLGGKVYVACSCGQGNEKTWTFDNPYTARSASEMHELLGAGHVCKVRNVPRR